MTDYDDFFYRDVPWPQPKRAIRRKELSESNIGDNFRHFQWNAIPNKLPHKAMLLDYIANIHVLEPKGIGMLLWGASFGHGKTASATQLLLECMRRAAIGGYFFEFEDLENVFRFRDKHMAANGDFTLAETLELVQILVIDEIGPEVANERNATWFKHLIRRRYNQRKVTFLATNLDPGFFTKSFPWFTKILLERYKIVEVKGKDFRVDAAKQNNAGEAS